MSKRHDPLGEIVIFRRFRVGRGGKVYDAWQYGVKAWPIRVKAKRLRK